MGLLSLAARRSLQSGEMFGERLAPRRAANLVLRQTDDGREYLLSVGGKDYEITVYPNEHLGGAASVSFTRKDVKQDIEAARRLDAEAAGSIYDATGDTSGAAALRVMRAIRDVLEGDAQQFRPPGYSWSPNSKEQRELYQAMLSRYGLPSGYEMTGSYPQVRRVGSQ